ncbi:MAG: carbamoyltransferase HypF [Planctomycetia bacterium]|nr:carbamoyltransferase HypF [Planctomycetia bacterium]
MPHAAFPDRMARRVLLQGQVQGIGLRPAVLRWASACNIFGWVANEPSGVVMHAEGNGVNMHRFLMGLASQLPDEAVISDQITKEVYPEGHRRFDVHAGSIVSTLRARVPHDTVICGQCLQEVLCGNDSRRQNYLFNNCAQCGPRFSILHSMPFEREHTSMKRFPLCLECRNEFTASSDRRFHAQTMSCVHCGPTLSGAELHDSRTAVDAGATLIRNGGILALKGIGGYQLICDATSDLAVLTLRQRKGRVSKPLAVMVRDLKAASTLADMTGNEKALTSRAGPLVLCRAHTVNGLSNHVHPGLNEVGIMLPTTACHYLLCSAVDHPLVITSGNREGEPLAYTPSAAAEQLGNISDQMLNHDRDIVRPIDDSVVRCMANRMSVIRLGRGLAPHTLPVNITLPLVALGGHQKVAMALCNREQSILGPHIGDMDTVAGQSRFVEQYRQLCQLYHCEPGHLVHDLHPDYFTTRWAEQQATPRLAVQHHHAHMVAAMLEHGWLGKTVLGIAFDGTGYGGDGSIWGGEVLMANVTEARRLAHLRPFTLPGGEMAVKQPGRVTLSLLSQLYDHHELINVLQQRQVEEPYQPWLPLLDVPQLHVQTTSVGRLFDGIACLLLSRFEAHYEGEPAMLLEACCDRSATGSYCFPINSHELDWRPMLHEILHDMQQGQQPGTIAMRFHRSVAETIVAIIRSYPSYPVVLAGGCFQNKILVELVNELLDDNSRIGLPGMIPCNDGGLAAGQLVVAAARLNCLSL